VDVAQAYVVVGKVFVVAVVGNHLVALTKQVAVDSSYAFVVVASFVDQVVPSVDHHSLVVVNRSAAVVVADLWQVVLQHWEPPPCFYFFFLFLTLLNIYFK
jgi:hypothetical protein